MTATTLKLVNDLTDQDAAELKAIEAEIKAAKKQTALAGRGGSKGPATGEILPPEGSQPRYDDLANAERFLDTFGDDLLYSAEAKKWLLWSGKYWEFDNTNLVFDLATQFAKDLYKEAIDDVAFKHAKRSNMRSGLNAVLEIAQRKKAVTMDEFDREPELLNCQNGTLNLRTGELMPHDRRHRITRIVKSDYDADATPDAFATFLETIQPDASIRAFLQRSIGYSLLGVVRERSFWILYGTGNNGKSVFVNLFNNLLGDYASATTTASVMAGKQSAIPNDIARLKGKRFVIIPETEENERLNSALVKALSAGDTVTARFLFGEYFDFPFTGKLWIATNHKPTITDHSKGMWDRMKLVPFTQNIPKEKVIKADDLMAALMAEAPAILNWAVTGCRDYFDMDGLDVPEVIQSEIDAYRREQDSIAQFIEERCQTIEQCRTDHPEIYIIASDFRVSNSDLYKAYVKFCDENGEFKRTHRRLTQNMNERGFRQVNSGGRYWEGIRLIDPTGIG